MCNNVVSQANRPTRLHHHMRCFHAQGCYRCQVCGALFETAYEAGEHVKEQHFFPEL
ncbi:hypothetical protein IWW50_001542 [Coemansia erecta]|nr:hypothetical protein IWW50_001542 [Coemansia erecta]